MSLKTPISSGGPRLPLASPRVKLNRDTYEEELLKQKYDALMSLYESPVAPDEEQPIPNAQLAKAGIEWAIKKKQAINMEIDAVDKETGALKMEFLKAEQRLQALNIEYLKVGAELWYNTVKKMRVHDTSRVSRDESLLAIYYKNDTRVAESDGRIKKSSRVRDWQDDWQSKRMNRPTQWRKDVIAYYSGVMTDFKELVWDHIVGDWHNSEDVKAAYIVPSTVAGHDLGGAIFGRRSPSLERAGNALLMSTRVKACFDDHQFFIIPVDPKELPITRWQAVLTFPDRNTAKIPSSIAFPPKSLHEKELRFQNDKRPVPRFLYFHFLTTLIRIMNLRRHGWQEVWAKYRNECCFPRPSRYMRKEIMVCLGTHFDVCESDRRIIYGWMMGHHFASPLDMSGSEGAEIARRVLLAMEERAERARRILECDDESSDDEWVECSNDMENMAVV